MQNEMNRIMQRIQAIETKFAFGAGKADPKIFQQLLKTQVGQQEKTPPAAKVSVQPKAAANSFSAAAGDDIQGIIAASAHKYGVDPRLADAVAQAESNYTPDAVSEAGAVGVMQLMPETASSLGVGNIYDPRENIEGGVKYIKQLLGMFGGDVKKAVAAYNAGPQAVKNYNGVPPYAETQNYVQKVLDIYR